MAPKENGNPTWIATDIDGTLLNSQMEVSLDTRLAYSHLMEAKIPVVPCTGRSIYALKQVLDMKSPDFNMRLTPGVYMHGTCVFGESVEDIVYAPQMPEKALVTFLETYYTLRERGAVDKCTLFMQNPQGSVIDYQTPFFAEWHSEQPAVIAQRPLLDLLGQFNCSQISVVGDKQAVSKFENLVKSWPIAEKFAGAGIRLEKGCSNMLIAISDSENKAKGLQELSKRYPQLAISELLAIGDGYNDLDMLRLSPWSVAMGQAPDEVKSAATRITLGNDENGWGQAVEKAFF
eukprot:Protomagalhaensia_wolfi_Nauph_80__3364@NODE_341_length_2746_cov_26_516808_g258_i0_p2_GENE_NODE_341_length_2746_cov_26_516808_g258_i0NODE_341_length_2746_cov_26_516808_g258_i0_p2_ORF_typecomplete_len290_score39_73Hydrolase_3/PF08282_12/1_7e39HAD/PF12710_7/1_4e02HAD/PF12710_7/0_00079S6PP/PF05116_13/87S6PP/PF05116_13/0_077Hydrolase/PF00702_26/1_1e02Hydrolase/PF00702_26/13_NODE_341_length_2746_cov_26_516808_g258_i049918